MRYLPYQLVQDFFHQCVSVCKKKLKSPLPGQDGQICFMNLGSPKNLRAALEFLHVVGYARVGTCHRAGCQNPNNQYLIGLLCGNISKIRDYSKPPRQTTLWRPQSSCLSSSTYLPFEMPTVWILLWLKKRKHSPNKFLRFARRRRERRRRISS